MKCPVESYLSSAFLPVECLGIDARLNSSRWDGGHLGLVIAALLHPAEPRTHRGIGMFLGALRESTRQRLRSHTLAGGAPVEDLA